MQALCACCAGGRSKDGALPSDEAKALNASAPRLPAPPPSALKAKDEPRPPRQWLVLLPSVTVLAFVACIGDAGGGGSLAAAGGSAAVTVAAASTTGAVAVAAAAAAALFAAKSAWSSRSAGSAGRSATKQQPAAESAGAAAAEKEAELVDELVRYFGGLAQKETHFALDAATCRRFLVARKGNLEAAKSSLTRYAQWRHEVQPQNIRPEDVPKEIARRRGCVHGRDELGRAIFWGFASRHDKNDRDIDNLFRWMIMLMEGAISKSEQQGLGQICVVFDLSGFGTQCMDNEFVLRCVDYIANMYPERLGQVVFWNAPSIFQVFWRLVRPWIDPVSVEKVQIAQGAQLAELIDPRAMPPDVADRMAAPGRAAAGAAR